MNHPSLSEIIIRLSGFDINKSLIYSAVFLGFYYFLIYNDGSTLKKNIKDLEDRLKEIESNLSGYEMVLSEYQVIKENEEAMRAKSEQLISSFKEEINPSELHKSIDKLSNHYQLKILSKQQIEDRSSSDLIVRSLNIEIEGSFANFIRFCHALKNFPKVIVIRGLQIIPKQEANDKNSLKLNMDLASYFLKEKNEN